MPAPAVIPALIVYIKVVAVKKLVVDHLVAIHAASSRVASLLSARERRAAFTGRLRRSGTFLRKN